MYLVFFKFYLLEREYIRCDLNVKVIRIYLRIGGLVIVISSYILIYVYIIFI